MAHLLSTATRRGFITGLIFLILIPSHTRADEPVRFGSQRSTLSRCIFDGLMAALSEGLNTTGLRQESKRASKTESVDKFFNALEARFGELAPRDAVLPGRANVTSTDYLQDLVLPETRPGIIRKAKIRIRTYGDRPDGTNADPKFRGLYRNYSKLEFKIDHPTEDQVVIKPSILMANQDIAAVMKKDFCQKHPDQVSEMRERAKEIRDSRGKPLNDPKLVDQMFDALAELHREMPDNDPLKRRINIQYERKSYKIELQDKSKTPSVPVEIQITVDRNIQYRSSSRDERAVVTPYRANANIVELKIPLEYAKLNDAQLRDILPDLVFIRQSYSQLEPVPEIPPGTGKSGSFKRLEKEIEQMLISP